MIAYRKTDGKAHDIRLVADDYTPIEGEVLLKGDVLPSVDALSDAPSARDLARAELTAIDMQLLALRWNREVALGAGQLVDILRNTPDTIVTVADLVAYLRGIPSPGVGMDKLRIIEAHCAELRPIAK